MEKITKFVVLAFIVVGISACGKMGELERVKSSLLVTPNITQTA
ncbi:hypothetical protein [Abyssogena phaseoliformis symbiont]|nr:hypothetical protein [Abyssogena phaseoliformis symbiont]MBW5289851.1 hypothetical protein [Candidatus Ruthia sp. Apha_13_S6]